MSPNNTRFNLQAETYYEAFNYYLHRYWQLRHQDLELIGFQKTIAGLQAYWEWQGKEYTSLYPILAVNNTAVDSLVVQHWLQEQSYPILAFEPVGGTNLHTETTVLISCFEQVPVVSLPASYEQWITGFNSDKMHLGLKFSFLEQMELGLVILNKLKEQLFQSIEEVDTQLWLSIGNDFFNLQWNMKNIDLLSGYDGNDLELTDTLYQVAIYIWFSLLELHDDTHTLAVRNRYRFWRKQFEINSDDLKATAQKYLGRRYFEDSLSELLPWAKVKSLALKSLRAPVNLTLWIGALE